MLTDLRGWERRKGQIHMDQVEADIKRHVLGWIAFHIREDIDVTFLNIYSGSNLHSIRSGKILPN